MGIEWSKLRESAAGGVDWFYEGERLPNTLLLLTVLATAAQLAYIVATEEPHGQDAKEPAARQQVLSD